MKLTFKNPGMLRAGRQSSNLKVVAMPIRDLANGAAERDANNKTALRAAWYVKNSPDHSIVQNLRMASGAEITENSFENSKYYNIPINITTDLIISEIFSHNPEGHNYSWVELYNGTLHDIDLSDYALGRSQYDWRYDKPNKGYIYAPFPSDYTIDGSSIGAKHGAALLTPLTMESPSEVVWRDGKPYSRTYDGSKLAQKAPLLVQKWGGVGNPITLNVMVKFLMEEMLLQVITGEGSVLLLFLLPHIKRIAIIMKTLLMLIKLLHRGVCSLQVRLSLYSLMDILRIG